MTTPANVVAFYAESHWGSGYGVVDAFHKTPHKGLDCGLFHGDVDVPALHPGVVVAAAASSSVGHYVTVRRADGLFDTYCHIVIGVSVGQSVSQGQRLGRQAITQAEGGTQWLGQHTHLCLSRTQAGWATWGYTNLDPTPGVIAALGGFAGGGSIPINSAQAQQRGHDDVEIYRSSEMPTTIPADYLALNAGLVSDPNKPLYFIAWPGLPPVITQDQQLITDYQLQQTGQASPKGLVTVGWFMFDQRAQFYFALAAALLKQPVSGGTPDNAGVIAAINDLKAAVLAPATTTKG